MDYTKKVSEFVAQTTYEDLPAKAIELAKQAILDSVAVTLAGSIEPASKICAQMAREESTSKDSSVSDRGSKRLVLRLRLLMGQPVMRWTMIITSSTWANPRPVWLRPPLRFQKSWERAGFFGSLRRWFRVTTKLVCSIPDHSSKEGWHSAGTLGALGAAVACAKLLGLEVEAVRTTLGIAASWRAVSSGTTGR
jgi:hypothetical protein